jgi:hypothetical protein
MPEAHYRVQVQKDHLRKLAGATALQAVAELIWNAVDADATQVSLEVESDDVSMRSITVRDNGHGIPHSDVETLFGKLGGSWKAHGSRSKTKGRILHGKEGRGRFKALALGRVADWTVKYRDGHRLLGYKITIIRDDLVDVRVTNPEDVAIALGPGVEVCVSELDRSFRSLESSSVVQSLSEIFALYLTDYRDVAIFIGAERLDPSMMIADRQKFTLSPITDGGTEFPAEVDVIRWTSTSERWFFFCGPEGFPYLRVAPKFHAPGFQFSAYLKSPFIASLQEQGLLDLAEMNAPLEASYEEASERVKEYLQSKQIEAAQTEIDRWKSEDVYPYRTEPITPVEKAERKVFDILALNVNRHLPDFAEQSRRIKTFQLRMLRQAMNEAPMSCNTS